jgi:hypothetical protein
MQHLKIIDGCKFPPSGYLCHNLFDAGDLLHSFSFSVEQVVFFDQILLGLGMGVVLLNHSRLRMPISGLGPEG